MYERLEQLGIAGTEARAYVALLRQPHLSGQQVGEVLGVTRSSAYAVLRSLGDKGLVEAGAGYGTKFRAVSPEEAVPSLIERQRQALHERERVAKELVEELAAVAESAEPELDQVVEVLRDRRVIAERFERLRQEAQREIWGFAKAPIIVTRAGNLGEVEALHRGVRVRTLYEASVLEDADVRPYLMRWIAEGEEARAYPGELPFKLALFDAKVALMPLETPNGRHPFTSVLIRHAALGAGLRILFECLWDQSEPLPTG